jgi:hypothetical protein
VAAVLACSGSARADRGRGVALVNPDAALEEAVIAALVPWRLDVIAVRGDGPGATMPASSTQARAIADRLGVGAVVWISVGDDGCALWVYDSDGDRVVARRLVSPPPFDDATAAAVALSIKTLLRNSAVAPIEERNALPSARSTAALPAREATLRFESLGGARARDTEAETLEPRLGVAVSWWPLQRFGGALGVSAGPGLSVDDPRFIGRYTDTAVSASVRARVDLGARFRVTPELGSSIHLTELDGALLVNDTRARVSRTNVSLFAGAAVTARLLDDVSAGVRAGGDLLLRNQRYTIAGDPVFSLPAAELEAVVFLDLRLY